MAAEEGFDLAGEFGGLLGVGGVAEGFELGFEVMESLGLLGDELIDARAEDARRPHARLDRQPEEHADDDGHELAQRMGHDALANLIEHRILIRYRRLGLGRRIRFGFRSDRVLGLLGLFGRGCVIGGFVAHG